MATITIMIPDQQVPRVKAAVVARMMDNPLAHPDFDPAKFTNADALAATEAQCRDLIRGLVASHEQAQAVAAAAASVDVSGLVPDPKP